MRQNIIISAIMLASACGPKTTAAVKQFVTCAESAAAHDLAPTVQSILTTGVASWAEQLSALAKSFGMDAINCAVASAKQALMPATMSTKAPSGAVGRADEWLSQHGAK